MVIWVSGQSECLWKEQSLSSYVVPQCQLPILGRAEQARKTIFKKASWDWLGWFETNLIDVNWIHKHTLVYIKAHTWPHSVCLAYRYMSEYVSSAVHKAQGTNESSPSLSERMLWPRDFPRRQTSQTFPNVQGSLALRLTLGMSQEPPSRTKDPSDTQSNWTHLTLPKSYCPLVVLLQRDKNQTWNVTTPISALPSSVGIPVSHTCFPRFVCLYLAVRFDLQCDRFQLPLMFM